MNSKWLKGSEYVDSSGLYNTLVAGLAGQNWTPNPISKSSYYCYQSTLAVGCVPASCVRWYFQPMVAAFAPGGCRPGPPLPAASWRRGVDRRHDGDRGGGRAHRDHLQHRAVDEDVAGSRTNVWNLALMDPRTSATWGGRVSIYRYRKKNDRLRVTDSSCAKKNLRSS